MDELIEGRLQLKHDGGGWRHFINKDDGQDRDIHCGAYMEVGTAKTYETGVFWLPGHYEGKLTNPVEAYLELGVFLAQWSQATITIPLETMVRVRK